VLNALALLRNAYIGVSANVIARRPFVLEATCEPVTRNFRESEWHFWFYRASILVTAWILIATPIPCTVVLKELIHQVVWPRRITETVAHALTPAEAILARFIRFNNPDYGWADQLLIGTAESHERIRICAVCDAIRQRLELLSTFWAALQ